MTEQRPHAIPCAIAALLLLGALGTWPYGYYTLLRWVICASAVYTAFVAYESKRSAWVWPLGFTALLFNPLAPVHLSRGTWRPIDVITALLFAVAATSIRKKRVGERDDASVDSGLRESLKTIFWAVVWIAGALWFWLALFGNPFDELALIRRAQTVPGTMFDVWEDVDEADSGQNIRTHGATYGYRLPDGREFIQDTRVGSGPLRKEFSDPDKSYPVEVEYLPEAPAVSRIRGDSSRSVSEWLWHDVGLSGLLLAMLLSPGVALARRGVLQLRGSLRNSAVVT